MSTDPDIQAAEAKLAAAEAVWAQGPRSFKRPGIPAGHVKGKAHQKIDRNHSVNHGEFAELPVSAQLGAVPNKEQYGFTTFRGHKVRDMGDGFYTRPDGCPVIHDERSRKHFGEMFNASDD